MSKLFVVATPIGNLSEISKRAIETLSNVSFILCEDTRVSSKLLSALGIKKKLVAFNKDNEKEIESYVIEKLLDGDIALISDAGMPVLSDPGAFLVNSVKTNGHEVIPISGPSAIVNAYAAAGFASENFLFLGFLPKKENDLKKILESITPTIKTFIYFDSPNRVKANLEIISNMFPQALYSVSREMTKIHETNYFGNYQTIIDKIMERGEFTIVVKPNIVTLNEIVIIEKEIRKLSSQGIDFATISKMIDYKFKISKNELYSLIMKVKNENQ